MAEKQIAVWEVYDLQRTCRLNARYWTARLAKEERKSFCIEFAMAFTAPGSAIAGLVFWKTDSGKEVWSALMLVTAVLGVAKPLLKLPDRIRTLHKVVAGYRALEQPLEELRNEILRERAYTAQLVKTYQQLHRQFHDVSRDEPVENVDTALRAQCYQSVKDELPESSFFIPVSEEPKA